MDTSKPIFICTDEYEEVPITTDELWQRVMALEERVNDLENINADAGWGPPPMERYTAPADTEAPDPNEPPPPPWEAR